MRKINVLFMQSQHYFGSDSMIHSLIMRHLDRSRVSVHVACNVGSMDDKSPSFRALEAIPDVLLRPTEFGPSVNGQTRSRVARDFLRAPPTLLSLTSLAAYAKKHQIDVVHGTEKPRDAFYGLLIGRLVGARCITYLHVKVEDWISPLVRWAMKHDDALIGVSRFVAESAIAKGYPAEKTHHVLNALDTSRWNEAVDGSAVRAELGIAPHVPLMAIISRLFPWKGHTDLLKALPKVKESVPEFKLLIVGEDDPRATPGGGSYMAELEALTRELGLLDQVVFTGFRSDIPQLLAASDVFAMPTFEEPCAVAFLEAMPMRKPIVALDSGGTPELVERGRAGLLSPPGDIDALAANLVAVLRDPDLRARMGEHGRQRVQDFLNPRRLANEIEQVYRRVLGWPAFETQAAVAG